MFGLARNPGLIAHKDMRHHSSSTPENRADLPRLDRLDGASDITDVDTLRALLAEARHERDEANHRIANNLHRAISLLRAQRRRVTAEASHYTLLTAEMRLTGIARLNQRLGAIGSARVLRLDKFLAELCEDLEVALNIECNLACDAVVVDVYAASQLGIILSELAMNAIKHAYDGREGERMTIQCIGDGTILRCLIADGGKGLPEDLDVNAPSSGLGLSVIARAVEQLGGNLTTHNDGGAVFVIVIPLPQSG